jgi:hypothetical protein
MRGRVLIAGRQQGKTAATEQAKELADALYVHWTRNAEFASKEESQAKRREIDQAMLEFWSQPQAERTSGKFTSLVNDLIGMELEVPDDDLTMGVADIPPNPKEFILTSGDVDLTTPLPSLGRSCASWNDRKARDKAKKKKQKRHAKRMQKRGKR